MAELDRVNWVAGVAGRAYGLRIGLRANDARALERIRGVLPPGWTGSASPVVDRVYSLVANDATGDVDADRACQLYLGAEPLGGRLSLDEVCEVLENSLHPYVAEFARRRLFVHAAVVGWRGRAIVLPGTSFAGKTTLVRALIDAGATFYSDEYAVFDARGRVHPFARPLSIREDGAAWLRREAVASPGTTALPVGLVAMARYRPGARWRPRRLAPGEAVLALLANTVAARRRPDVAFRTLREVVSGAQAVKGTRGEAQETARSILCACAWGK
jgi:hypothetical protein